jgi:hypothetical protein
VKNGYRKLIGAHEGPQVPWLWYYGMANVRLTQVHRKRIVFEGGSLLSLIGEMRQRGHG